MASVLYSSDLSAVVSQITLAAYTTSTYSTGFESGFTGWTASGSTHPTLSQVTVSHSGTYGLQIDTTATGTTTTSRTITTAVGASYTLSAWAGVYVGTASVSVTGIGSSGTVAPVSSGSFWQLLTFTFTATGTSTVVNLVNAVPSSYGTVGSWDDVTLLRNYPAVLGDYPLQIISGSVKLDEARAPYAEGVLTVQLPELYTSEQITPFTGLRLKITATQSFTAPVGRAPQSRSFDLLLHEVQIDSEAATMRLVGESDEASLIGYAEGAQQRTYGLSVKDAVAYGLSKIGATLEAGAADATLTASAHSAPTSNYAPNPRGFTGVVGWLSTSGTVSRLTPVTVPALPAVTTAIRTTMTAASGGLYLNADVASPKISVSAGQTYTWSAWVRASQAITVGHSIQWNNGTTNLGSTNAPSVALAANTWTLISGSHIAPAGAAFAGPYTYSTTAWTAGATYDLTGLTFNPGTSVSSFIDGDLTQSAGAGYYWKDGATSGSINEQALANVVQNTNTKYGLTGWLTAYNGGGAGTSSSVPTGGPTVSPYFYRTTITTAAPAGLYNYVDYPYAPIQPSVAYFISVWVRTSVATTVQVYLGDFNSAGTSLTTPTSTATAIAANTWTRLTMTTTFSSTAVALRAHVRTTVGTIPVSGTFDTTAWTITKGSTDPGDFDGDTVDTATYNYEWLGSPGASTSLRTGPHNSDTTVWKPGQTAWDWVASLVSAGKLRLFCDEQRKWRLIDPASYMVPGLVTVSSGTNATAGTDLRSLQATDVDGTPTYFSLCVVHWTWTDAAGLSQEFYEAAGTPGNPLNIEIERPYPGPRYAAAVLARAQGKGRTQELSALSDLTATPGMELISTLPGVTPEDGTLASVEWQWDMESDSQAVVNIGSRGLIATPANAWVLALGNWSAATGTWAGATGTN